MEISEYIQKFLQEKGITCLYHFTDRDNIFSIIKNGGLLSWKDCEKERIEVIRPGGDDLSRSLDESKGLANYVRLSFCPEHPMMFAAKNDGRIANPVIMKISTNVCCFPDTLFSDINATSNARIKGGLEGLNLVDFDIVTRNYSTTFTDDIKAKYQAEILVKHKIPLEHFINYSEIKSLLTKKELKELETHWERELDNINKQIKCPKIHSFKQSVINYVDQAVKVHWEASDFTKIRINNKEISAINHDVEIEPGIHQCCLSVLNELHIVNELKELNKILSKEDSQTIKIEQFKIPIINLTCDKMLIKKQQDNQVTIFWDIEYAASATMHVGDTQIPLNSMKGSCVLVLSETTSIYINACGLDRIRTFKSGLVNVVAKYESIINTFGSDKQYSITDVPFKISWDVSYANRIYIKSDNNAILSDNLASQGFDYYTLRNRVFLSLCVEDDFGIKEKTIELDIMPKPHIQYILVPIPEIEHHINMGIVTNSISSGVSFPKVIDVKTPMFASTKLTTNKIKNRSLSKERVFLIRLLNNSINTITKKGVKLSLRLKSMFEIAKNILKIL